MWLLSCKERRNKNEEVNIERKVAEVKEILRGEEKQQIDQGCKNRLESSRVYCFFHLHCQALGNIAFFHSYFTFLTKMHSMWDSKINKPLKKYNRPSFPRDKYYITESSNVVPASLSHGDKIILAMSIKQIQQTVNKLFEPRRYSLYHYLNFGIWVKATPVPL